MNNFWFDAPEKKFQLTEEESNLLKDEKPFVIRSYGNLDQPTLEAVIVGHMVSDVKLDKDDPQKLKMDKICNSGIAESWFERADLGRLFTEIKTQYKIFGRIPSIDEMGEVYIGKGNKPQEASAYKHKIRICRGTLHAWRIGVDILIERFWAHYSQKLTEKMYSRYRKEAADPTIGPVKAANILTDNLKNGIKKAEAAEIKVFDLVDDFPNTYHWLSDMKDNPDKHKGFSCGIKAIDKKTHGFRKGHLTVVVGAHGGFKTTLMMNMAYGLYENGHNVLYVSLEMEKDIVQTKILCRATGTISYTRLYQGCMSRPEDWAEIRKLENEILDPNLTTNERSAKTAKITSLKSALKGINEGENREDSCQLKQTISTLENGRKNKFRTMIAGQSKKIKASQIESWILENIGDWKPDVVFLDYLALMDSETPYLDRPDLSFGEICQYAREMGKNHGFSVVTAAQLKRAALDRLKKSGVDTPEKADLDTGDIEDSNKIGANADNVFILWREPGGNSIRIFTAKSRYGEKDTSKGESVQIDHESCTISDNIRDISARAAAMTTVDNKRLTDFVVKKLEETAKTGLPDLRDKITEAPDDIFDNPALDRLDDDSDDGPIAPSGGLDI